MTIQANKKGICPHCKMPNRFEDARADNKAILRLINIINGVNDTGTPLSMCRCTNCSEVIIFFKKEMIYPKSSMRLIAPKEVPASIADDFNEACLVESLSPKASAALARRCLQNLLHDRGIKKRNLNDEISEAIKQLPSIEFPNYHINNSFAELWKSHPFSISI